MKKTVALIMVFLLALSMTAMTGCGSETEDPGPPPEDVIDPEGAANGDDPGSAYDGEILEGAVQVSIGQGGGKTYTVNYV